MASRSPYELFALLWREFFKDPSQWVFKRNSGPAYPDFEHKVSKHVLWIYGRFTPPWVIEELRRRGFAVQPPPACTEVPCRQDKRSTGSNNSLLSDVGNAYVSLLRACAKKKDLHRGASIHVDIEKRGLIQQGSDALIIMYAKCGAIEKAVELLELHGSNDVFAWTSIIAGFTRRGQGLDALDCFERMTLSGLSPDAITFTCILKACSIIRTTDKGKQIHHEMSKQGLLEDNDVLGNALVDMYAKCGIVAKAHQLLSEQPVWGASACSSLIRGYVGQSCSEQALYWFERMQQVGLSTDAETLSSVLKVCASTGSVARGEQIHGEITRKGFLRKDVVLGTALLDMYAKCGAIGKAQQLLEELNPRDVASWNALIAQYAKQGKTQQALDCFEYMKCDGISPDSVTFLGILKAYGNVGAMGMGKLIHDRIIREGLLGKNIILDTALVSMYVKCGAVVKAQQLHEELPVRDAISWSVLVQGYVHLDDAEQTLQVFEKMQEEGFTPSVSTLVAILKSCSSMGAAGIGEQIHSEIARQGLLENDLILGNALVSMYAKCGALAKARRLLVEMPTQDIISWNAIIAGYVQEGQVERVLESFEQLQFEGLLPNAVTFLSVLKMCGMLGLQENVAMYFKIMTSKHEIKPGIEHYTCVISSFGQSGHLDRAAGMIEKIPSFENSRAAWSTLLGVCEKLVNAKVGRWAFEQIVTIDEIDAMDGYSYG